MTTPSGRIYPVQLRGQIRQDLLTAFAVGAPQMLNPTTGKPFSPAEVAAAIAPKSPRYIEADAIDLVLQVEQSRGLYLADQINPLRASTAFLQDLWSPLWGVPYLAASGGSGPVSAPCSPGTTFFGSTTIGDPTATVGIDQNQARYQVLYNVTSDANGDPATVQVLALDTGVATNLSPGAQITWSDNAPLGQNGPATVTSQFSGGLPAETDAQHARRIARYIRHKQGGGNRAQLEGWAESFTNAIEVAFVYSTFMHAGTCLVVVVPKRPSNVRGPSGRIASSSLVGQVTGFLVPPGSTTVPDLGQVMVLGATGVSTDYVLGLDMPFGVDAGWADFLPWPSPNGAADVEVTAITDQQHFQVVCSTPLPAGVTAPQLMAWNVSSSSFFQLDVASVTLVSGSTYNVVLNTAPSTTLLLGMSISPYAKLNDSIALAAQAYMDELGPGEVIDVSSNSTDPRRGRAWRFVPPNEEYPQRAGSNIISVLQDALFGSVTDGVLLNVSVATPPLPTDPSLGPTQLTLGRLAVYPLDA